MTGTNVATDARYVLNDVSGARWTDAEMLVWVVAAQTEIVKRRPESRYTSSVVTTALSNPTALGDTLSIPDTYRQAMVDYICWRCFSKDADFSGNRKRAETHLEYFGLEIS